MELAKILEISIAAVVALCAASLFIRWPRLGIAFALAVTCFVPSWLIFRIGVQWTPAALCAVLMVPAILSSRRRYGWRPGDVVATCLILLCLVAFWQGGTPKALATQVIVRGFLIYLVARHLAPKAGLLWTRRAFVAILLICAAWSIVEYVLEWHVFTSFDLGSPEAYWAAIQARGGHIRSVAAFGQPIALGGTLAMAVPFIVASSWRTLSKLAALTLIGFGVLATISRGPMTAVLVGFLLTIMLYRGDTIGVRQRRVIVVGTLVVSVILYVGLVAKITAAGTEASQSAAYRGTLYSYFLSDIHPLSLGNNITYINNRYLYRGLGSIDSTFIYASLFYGWLPVALFIVSLLVLALRALRRRAGPAAIALLAQIPVLATVAPITQYQSLLWFLGGLVVAESLPVPGHVSRPGQRLTANAVSAEGSSIPLRTVVATVSGATAPDWAAE
jgi:hypothetical protein